MKYKVTLNGRTFEVEVEAGQAMLIDEYEACAPVSTASAAAPVPAAPAAPAVPSAPAAPAASAVTAEGEVIPAPMPGTVVSIEVTQGSAVKAGQLLLVLEAMKMENGIVAPRDGTITQVVVQKGHTVETGAPLVVLA